MEQTPYTPRQRNRRAERNAVEPEATQPVQQEAPAPQMQPTPQAIPAQPMPGQPVYPAYQPMPAVQQIAPVQPMQQPYPAYPAYPQGQMARPVQQYPQQTPPLQPTAPMQPVAPQPMYPPQGTSPYARPVLQVQPVTPVPPSPAMQQVPRQPQQPSVQYTPRRPANTTWQSAAALPDVPRARQAHGLAREQARDQARAAKEQRREAAEKARAEAAKAEKAQQDKAAEQAEPAARKKFPAWLSTALSLMLVGVMALIAAQALMRSYLVNQEKERQAAYQAVLDNFHVTQREDGALRVTWQDAIERYAAQYNLQPAFVTAIIRHESSFRTNAESGVGARGLMQMMPSTAEWIAGKLDDDNYHFDNMWDGETNIRYGCWYLGYLSELFGGDPILVACAYHAGQGEVRSWLGDSAISLDGATVSIDRIPINETKTYAGRVTQAYGIYQTLLYPDAAF